MKLFCIHKFKEKARHQMRSKYVLEKHIPGYLLIIEECVKCGKTRNIHIQRNMEDSHKN